MAEIKIGVSPAYHISRYGDRFTPENVAASLRDILALGFSSFQLEIYHPDTLNDWIRQGSAIVAYSAEQCGIFPSQFVGHFLCHGFDSPSTINSDFGIDEIKSCLGMLKFFPDCKVINVSMPAFSLAGVILDGESFRRLYERFTGKMRTILGIVEDEGKKMCVEILPGSFIGGIQGFLRLADNLGSPNFGYNFDTGHAWACREAIELIPGMLSGKIFGTHLKDHDQTANRALAPGKGTIPWDPLIRNLLSVGYRGNFDIEIICQSEEIESQYRQGMDFIKSKLS